MDIVRFNYGNWTLLTLDVIPNLYTNTAFYFFSYLQELVSDCNPVVSKPKPKVEPPKEEQKEAEQNGPVNGQENTETPPASNEKAPESKGQPAAPETTDSKLPEMDID